MNLYGYQFIREQDLTHHGIKGQKWGVRRFQNADGTWTSAGKARYGDSDTKKLDKLNRLTSDATTKWDAYSMSSKAKDYRAAQRATTKQRKFGSSLGKKYNLEFNSKTNQFDSLSRKTSEQVKYDKAFQKNYIKAYNRTAAYLNGPNGYQKLNSEWASIMSKYDGDWSKSPKYGEYVAAANKLFDQVFETQMESLIGKRPQN